MGTKWIVGAVGADQPRRYESKQYEGVAEKRDGPRVVRWLDQGANFFDFVSPGTTPGHSKDRGLADLVCNSLYVSPKILISPIILRDKRRF